MNKIEAELSAAEQTLSTDSYSMSVGELISSYTGGEIEINPAFQRVFRWTDYAKSRLIESFLLGLPVPPVFVYQKGSGHWELIDGLQRVSTILQFVGELRDKQGELVPPLVLTDSKYLPSLKGITWKGTEKNPDAGLPDSLKLKFRKSRLDVKIILPKSNELSKYELFDRLNTGGTPATAAEVRNCIVIMKDPKFFDWLDSLVTFPAFAQTIPLTDRQLEEQYRFELLVRYLILQTTSAEEARNIPDLETYLNERILELIDQPLAVRTQLEIVFKEVFTRLSGLLEENAFRRFNSAKKSYTGPFLLAAFEVIALGMAINIDVIRAKDDDWLSVKLKELWEQNLLKSVGLRSSQRLALTIPLTRTHFSES